MSAFARVKLVRSGGDDMLRAGARGWGWYHRSLKKMNAPEAAAVAYDAVVPTPTQPRPRAFLDVSIGGAKAERIVVEVAKDIVPQTATNFIKMCTEGFKSRALGSGSYKNSKFHNVTKGVYLVGGDVLKGDGTGGHAALVENQRFFDDENYALQFSEVGVLGMANAGINKNASQFFISLKPLPHLNGRNVAFGKVVEGTNILKNIESVYCVKHKPLTDIEIVSCGIL
ncbi:peptidyl-prolyl cis-trans [Plasmopara halstedii]|uniref:Peptidyl-prolyl cis-trans isomerase n=1 Tax=Plasmopara halstedii TaxID=4781 RepID=A0A0N7L4P0_PLAHL|nr:peptidyl-prolyl cis-trans [Plasmopara halstedii]CEG39211.1 peptidyl-prolyl cis-trans [Plasmopara halstedii]|eukprot:XP_024575580.1 peptidyl-prolyl cis-trans [Plasmopara halstedii]